MADEKAATDKKTNVNPEDLPIPEELPVLPLNDFVFFPGMGLSRSNYIVSTHVNFHSCRLFKNVQMQVAHPDCRGHTKS